MSTEIILLIIGIFAMISTIIPCFVKEYLEEHEDKEEIFKFLNKKQKQ